MSRDIRDTGTPGFQGSETTSVDVAVYHRDEDPIIFESLKSTHMGGTYKGASENALMSCTTQKGIGGNPGTFSFTVKPAAQEELLDRIVDDDWVDITFKRHNEPWHVMRGLVGDIRESEVVSGTGATTRTVTVTGQDFTKIWALTPIWFNRYSLENVAGSVAYQVLGSQNIGGVDVEQTVQRFLRDFLEPLAGTGRANWIIPSAVPALGGKAFMDVVQARVSDTANDPERTSLSTSFMQPQGTAWTLAKEWSDPLFNELFADIVFDDALLAPAFPYGPADTGIGYYLRGKPFVNSVDGINSPWFDLPINGITPQDIVRKDIGRGGGERYNAFFVGPQTTQEAVNTTLMDIAAPYWDTADILIHGLRRFDVESKYIAPSGASSALTLAPLLRERIADWYAINPYLLNGSIQLGICRPEIRAGTRLSLRGLKATLDAEYYVEDVTHNWTFGSGGRTSMMLTRGWVGSATDLVNTVQALAERYATPEFAQPGPKAS